MTNCPKCESPNDAEKPDSRGYFRCKECGKNYKADPDNNVPQSHTTTIDKDLKKGTATITGRVPRKMSNEELAEHFNIDLERYRIVRVVYSEREAYRKDKEVEWDVSDGRVMHGRVRDSGKLLIEPLLGVKVFTELNYIKKQRGWNLNQK